jgi:hypothetical protein
VQIAVLEVERLVIVVDLRHVRVGEYVGEHPPLAAQARLDPAVRLAAPAALPLVLVLPLFGIADARLALDVVEPVILGALT